MIRHSVLFLGLATAAWAQYFMSPLPEDSQLSQAADSDYEKGLSNLDARQWEAAIVNFDAAAARNKSLTDASLYWKAYALTRAGRLEESLATIEKLEKSFPASRWIRDAQALSLEVHADAGKLINPASEVDQDLKLLALNTLLEQDAKAALPALLKVINGSGSDKTKEHALFVLAQSDSPEARKALMDLARKSAEPALQMTAVRMMGMVGGDGARNELAGLYTSSSNLALKHEILNGLMESGSKSALLTVARTESNPALRNSAIVNLSMTGGQAELSDLYKSGANSDEKKQILNSVFLTGDAGMLQDVLKHEQDAGLRVAAINSLGAMGGQGVLLTQTYRTETNDAVRRAILDALVVEQNSAALTELAHDEKDQRVKADILSRLAKLRTRQSPGERAK